MATAYPSVLPVALVQSYGFKQVKNTKASDNDSGPVNKALISKNRTFVVTVEMLYDLNEMSVFEYWYNNVLSLGARWFQMDLQLGETLQPYECRFMDEFVATPVSDESFSVKFSVEVRNGLTLDAVIVGQPIVEDPANLSVEIDPEYTFRSSLFQLIQGADEHLSTDWQFATDSLFTSIVLQSLDDTVNLTSFTPALDALEFSTTYYLRVRYKSVTGVLSAWSPTHQFDTIVTVVLETPIIVNPTEGETLFPIPGPYIASAFNVLEGAATHLNTDWQWSLVSDFSVIDFESLADATNLTQIDLDASNLDPLTTYYMRVRYRPNVGEVSDWSATRTFSTADAVIVVKPVFDNIFNGSTHVLPSKLISTDAFTSIPPGETHLNSDWEVATNVGFTSIEFDSINDAVNKNEIRLPDLARGETKYIRMRKTAVGPYDSVYSDTLQIGFAEKMGRDVRHINASATIPWLDFEWTDLNGGFYYNLETSGSRIVTSPNLVDFSVHTLVTDLGPTGSNDLPIRTYVQFQDYFVICGGPYDDAIGGADGYRFSRTYDFECFQEIGLLGIPSGLRIASPTAMATDGNVIICMAYASTGANTYALRSLDGGLTWSQTLVVTGSGSGSATGGLKIADGIAVYVTANGNIYYSTDNGASWTEATSPTTNSLVSIDHDGTKFVAVGNSGTLIHSGNGVDWSVGSSGTADSLDVVRYYPTIGRWVISESGGLGGTIAVSSTGGTSGYVNSTPDVGNQVRLGPYKDGLWYFYEGGDFFTSSDFGATLDATSLFYPIIEGVATSGVAYIPSTNEFVVKQDSARLYYANADNLFLWKRRNFVTPASFTNTCMTYGNGRLLACGVSGTARTSTDGGLNWVTQTTGFTFNIRQVRWFAAANLFVAVGDTGGVATTPDGASWTNRTTGSAANFRDVSFDGVTYVIVGTGGTIFTTTDFVTFTPRTSGTTDELISTDSNGSSFCVGGIGRTTLFSTDGSSWVSREPTGIGLTSRMRPVVWTGEGYWIGVSGTPVITLDEGLTWEYILTSTIGASGAWFAATGNGRMVVQVDGDIGFYTT